jgi:hypothetical protein
VTPATNAVASVEAEPAPPVAKPARRVRTAAKPAIQAASPKTGGGMMLVRTYEFADGRTVTVRHQINSRDDRPALENDGVLSQMSSRNARIVPDDD